MDDLCAVPGTSPSYVFPSDGVRVQAAKHVCANCPVRTACLEYTLANNIEHGIWGGASERERRRILESRRSRTAGAP